MVYFKNSDAFVKCTKDEPFTFCLFVFHFSSIFIFVLNLCSTDALTKEEALEILRKNEHTKGERGLVKSFASFLKNASFF